MEARLLPANDKVIHIPVEAPQLQQHIDEVLMVQTVLKTVEACSSSTRLVKKKTCRGAEADPHPGPVSCGFQGDSGDYLWQG